MTGHRITLKGVKVKDGKIEKIPGYGLDASARIRQKKSKKVRVVKHHPDAVQTEINKYLSARIAKKKSKKVRVKRKGQ